MSSITATPAAFTAFSDAVESRRAAFVAYLATLSARGDFARHFTDEVSFTVVGGPEARGRDAVEATIRAIHEQMFDSRMLVRATVVEPGRAIAELTFVGTHVGDFMGIAPTGRQVEVPYGAAYDFTDDGRIEAIRVYFPMHLLMAQLGAGA